MHKKRVWSAGIIIILIVSSVGIAYWYDTQKRSNARVEMHDEYYLYEFNDDERDVHSIEKFFEQEFYWLTTAKAFDVRAMLARRSSDYTNPNVHNDMWIYIMRDTMSDAFIGFITFFKISFYKGQIWLVGVTKDFRRKGYCTKLIQLALHIMKDMGIKKVTILTRTDNPLRDLCKGIGFKESIPYPNVGFYYDIDL